MTEPLEVETHPDAQAAWRAIRRDLCRRLLAPPPRLTVVEWAERHRYLSSDNSAEAGRYRYSRAPFLREMAEAITDPTVEHIVVQKSAQVGYTEGVVGNAIGYYIDQDPSPILVMQPTLDDAQRWSKKKLMPMVRASPRLRAKVAESRPGDASNTILQKGGPGWSLSIVGAQSPRQMRSDSIRLFFADERSGYPRSAGVEGDPFLLGSKRTLSFERRKIVEGSTPTLKPDPIEHAYRNSDQREYEVPCPHCAEFQVLRFSNLRWDKDGEGLDRVHRTETAHFVCEGCGCVIEERHKRTMVEAGRWVARNPGHPVRGYFIWQAYSLFPNASWANIAAEWIAAQGDPEKLKIFFNTVLGESFEERGEKPDTDALSARREVYAAEVPGGVGVLTASVDVQGDRLELLVKGWGDREESWLIKHHRIFGDPNGADVWARLDALLMKRYRHESGQELLIQACCVDASDNSDAVYAFVKPRQRRKVYAVKGHVGKARPVMVRPGKAKDKSVRLFIVGVDTAKDRVFARLRIQPPGEGERPQPGFMHFPLPQDDGADDAYLRQFGNEVALRKTLPNGEVVRYYKKRGPNEAIDLEVYALAALHVLGDAVRQFMGSWATRMMEGARAADAATAHHETPAPAAAETSARAEEPAEERGVVAVDDPPAPAPARRRRPTRGRRGGGWMDGFR